MLKPFPVLRTLLILFVGTTVSLSCVWGMSEKGVGKPGTSYETARTIVSFLLSFVIPVGLVLYALITSIRVRTKAQGLTILLLSYLSLIISFSSVYYSITWISDLRDTTDEYYYYWNLGNMWPEEDKSDPPFRSRSARGFKGMETKLWLGIEDYARPYYYQKDMNAPVRDIIKLTDRDFFKYPDYASRYQAGAKWEVFLDCLHYSIVTMATVGYGDIVPQSRLAKVMTDIEIISGQALFVFALGIVFGKVGPQENKEKGLSVAKDAPVDTKAKIITR